MRNLMWSSLAAGLLLIGASALRAQDTVRLGGPASQNDVQGDTDTMLTRGGGGGGRGGGFGGGRGGGFGGRGFGYGGRGFGYGGYGYGRGWGYGGYGYGGYGYGGFGYGGGYWPYYYAPYYYPSYYYGASYYPIAGDGSAPVTLAVQNSNYYQAPAGPPTPQVLQAPFGTGTFPYNGGPQAPIPMPAPSDVNPMKNPQGMIPLDGKLVSLSPTTIVGFAPATPRDQNTKAAHTPPARIAYPAYGEEPAARKR